MCVIALPTAARAQSAIGGTVKDTSGAVLPGVTVEVASDVLIEKTKSVSTDGEGEYTIVDLRPGVYTITFSLQGFNTFKREGLELPSNFTATVNADMKVGALEESVTVSGSSPVVDVQSNQKTQVLSRDVLDAVPTGKTIQGLGQLVVGVTLSSPDVGGSRAMQQAYFAVHGVGASGAIVTVDGLLTNGNMADGAVMAYHNEVDDSGSGLSDRRRHRRDHHRRHHHEPGARRTAATASPARMKYGKSPSSWQGDNLTPRLKALGVSAVDKISNFYEFNIEEGGPIMKDKLWFFGAFRRAHYDKPIANTFVVPAGAQHPGLVQVVSGDARLVRAGHLRREDGQPGRPPDLAGVAAQQVRGLHGPRAAPARPRDGQPDRHQHRVGGVAHADVRDRLGQVDVDGVVEAAASRPASRSTASATTTSISPASTSLRQRRRWYAGARKSDNSTGLLWNASSAQLGNYPDKYNVIGGGLVRDRLAQRQGRLRRSVRTVPALEHRERRPLSGLQQRRAAVGDGAQHAAADRRVSRRQPRALRAGRVAARTS